MINLLPKSENQKLLFEKKKKLSIILGIIILAVLICFILILLSIKFYLLSEVDAQKNILKESEIEKNIIDFDNYTSVIKSYNQKFEKLDNFYSNTIYFEHAFNIILSIQKPDGLKFKNFSLARTDDNKVNVSISGTSESRDDLLIFKKNIENVREIENSIFSSSSWISPKDVNFSLTFQINQNEGQ